MGLRTRQKVNVSCPYFLTNYHRAMHTLEIVLFIVAVVGVIGLGIWMSRDEDTHGDKGASDYFLAGRGLTCGWSVSR